MVRDRASSVVLGLAGIQPATTPSVNFNIEVKADYVIDLSDDPPPRAIGPQPDAVVDNTVGTSPPLFGSARLRSPSTKPWLERSFVVRSFENTPHLTPRLFFAGANKSFVLNGIDAVRLREPPARPTQARPPAPRCCRRRLPARQPAHECPSRAAVRLIEQAINPRLLQRRLPLLFLPFAFELTLS
jgi:hypothetical protein